MAYHSTSTWVHDSRQAGQDLEGKNPTYHYSGIVSQPLGTKPTDFGKHSPSNAYVDRAMRTLKRKNQQHQQLFNRMTTLPHAGADHRLGASTYSSTLEQNVEPLEVPNESINQCVPAFLSEVVPESKWRRRGAVTEGIRVGAPIGVIPSDLVGDGVSKFEVLRKGTGSDFIIVSWVTPTAKSSCRGIVEDRCIGEVGACICEVEYQHDCSPTVPRTRQLTQSPVPVRVSSLIAAFGLQCKLEII